jgi:hypothetical protein
MCGRIAIALSALLLSGCAIHPVPEDVTGVNTSHIVQQIRCEARTAAVGALISYLENRANDRVAPAQKWVDEYKRDPDTITRFKIADFNNEPNVENVLKTFFAIGVAYNFVLTMSEENNLTAGTANFKETVNRSVFTLGVGAGATRKRSNNRTFTVTDTFEYLIRTLNKIGLHGRPGCDGYIVQENYIYPIAGRVGIDKVVYDFLDLVFFRNLGKKDATNGPPTMTEQLTFTTNLDTSATPKIMFTPTGTGFQLTDAFITAGVKRNDLHEVTIGLALPTDALLYLASVRSVLYPAARSIATAPAPAGKGGGPAQHTVLGTRVIGSGTPAEALAVLAIDQVKSQEVRLQPPQ